MGQDPDEVVVKVFSFFEQPSCREKPNIAPVGMMHGQFQQSQGASFGPAGHGDRGHQLLQTADLEPDTIAIGYKQHQAKSGSLDEFGADRVDFAGASTPGPQAVCE
ncbi:hypothetical protein ACFQZZ_00315 [Nocardia sp. GCM10030253]|uniref:hypothetical protein n=1 Tax=Nocardia sp. GCM10030253 TaxID=3273404 RepID=UPI0036343AA0